MKFVTSRILSPSQTRSLKQIIEDTAKQKSAEVVTKTASSKPSEKIQKVAASIEAKSNVKNVETKPVVSNKTNSKKVEVKRVEAKKVEEKKVEAKKTVGKTESPVSKSKKIAFKFHNLSKKASLSKMDESYLKKYYSIYYPADFVDALLAKF